MRRTDAVSESAPADRDVPEDVETVDVSITTDASVEAENDAAVD